MFLKVRAKNKKEIYKMSDPVISNVVSETSTASASTVAAVNPVVVTPVSTTPAPVMPVVAMPVAPTMTLEQATAFLDPKLNNRKPGRPDLATSAKLAAAHLIVNTHKAQVRSAKKAVTAAKVAEKKAAKAAERALVKAATDKAKAEAKALIEASKAPVASNSTTSDPVASVAEKLEETSTETVTAEVVSSESVNADSAVS